MTSRRQIQDGGPHDFRSKMAAPMTSDPRWRPHRVRSKMAAPMTSGPRWRPPWRQIQDGGPHDVRSKMAAPTKSDTRWRPLWRVRFHLGGWVNALDHEKVASRPRARCRSSIYKGEGPLIYFRSSERDPVFNDVAGRSALFIPFPGWTLFFQHGPFTSFSTYWSAS